MKNRHQKDPLVNVLSRTGKLLGIKPATVERVQNVSLVSESERESDDDIGSQTPIEIRDMSDLAELDSFLKVLSTGRWNDGLEDGIDDGMDVAAGWKPAYCSLYQTNGFSLTNSHEEEGTSSKLSLDISRLCRIETVTNSKNDDPYQKCVRLYTLGKHLYMATGGSDGFVRIWNLSEMITGDLISSNQKLDEDVPPTDIGGEPTFEIQTEGEIVDELDVSKCGSVLSVVLDKKTVFYDTENGHQLLQLDIPKSSEKIISKKEVRSHIISLARACDEVFLLIMSTQRRAFGDVKNMVDDAQRLEGVKSQQRPVNKYETTIARERELSNCPLRPDEILEDDLPSCPGKVIGIFDDLDMEMIAASLESSSP
ncbi:SEC like protein [Ditylenchus destructor]|uniref:SEC like protein n=1 Tax=Ditylenchus destructor TaxID=166010 RepID=A0AAD4N2V3_9BILA|nr:SEC like protein [Ditylenchus destructor]